MTAVGDVICLVMLWSLRGPALVSGQCTTVGCSVEYHSNDLGNLYKFDADDDRDYRSELDELRLQTQLLAEELGT